MINGINPVGNIGHELSGGSEAGQTRSGQTFSRMLDEVLENTAQNLEKADHAALEANTGGPVDLHEVMIAMEKADISLRLLVQVRNKAVDAYQEIMRMQV